MATEAKAFVAAMCIHTPVLARPGFDSTFIHILTAGLPGVPWKASTFIRSHTFSKFASGLTCSFTESLAVPFPAIAAGYLSSIATEARLACQCWQPVIPWTGPYSTCHPGEQQQERQVPGQLHIGGGVGPRSLSCAPQDLGHRGVTVSSLLRWPGPWFCAQLAGSVAASAERTAGLES